MDRYAYGDNRPGNASVAYVAETQLRDIQKTLPLRVLSAEDWNIGSPAVTLWSSRPSLPKT